MYFRSFVLVVSGAALGIALILSCGHPSPNADAADQCTCPAAEPPLAGRVVQVTQEVTVPANDFQVAGAHCATAAATLLGGGCRGTTVDHLGEDGPLTAAEGAPGWYCRFN